MWRGDERGRRVRGSAAVRSRVEVAVRRYAPEAQWGLWALAALAAAAVLVALSLAGCSRGSRAAGGPEEI